MKKKTVMTKKYSYLLMNVIYLISVFMFTSCSARTYEKNSYEISEVFSNIDIDLSNGDIKILPSTDGKCNIECKELKNLKYSAMVSDNTLKITEEDDRYFFQKWFGTGEAGVTIYLPENAYNSVMINNTTGDTYVENLRASTFSVECTTGDIHLESSNVDGKVGLSVTTGDIIIKHLSCSDITIDSTTGDKYFSDISCNSIFVEGSTGDCNMTSVIAANKITIDVTTSDICFDKCDAAEIEIKATTGNVEGSFLTDKIVFAHTTTGKVNVPQSTVGGKCTIETTTGDIKITITGK